MRYSKYKQKKIDLLKDKVFFLYKEGKTLREIEKIIDNERTHAWIGTVINEKEAKLSKK